jgi:hypothetical protein
MGEQQKNTHKYCCFRSNGKQGDENTAVDVGRADGIVLVAVTGYGAKTTRDAATADATLSSDFRYSTTAPSSVVMTSGKHGGDSNRTEREAEVRGEVIAEATSGQILAPQCRDTFWVHQTSQYLMKVKRYK